MIEGPIMSVATPLFSDKTSRDQYFKRIEEDPQSVQYGDCVLHVLSTNLGVWGSEELLFEDCARILQAEILKKLSLAVDCQFEEPTIHTILHSYRFKVAMALARRPNRADMHNVVRSLGTNSEHMSKENGDIPDLDLHHHLLDLHIKVAEELAEQQAAI